MRVLEVVTLGVIERVVQEDGDQVGRAEGAMVNLGVILRVTLIVGVVLLESVGELQTVGERERVVQGVGDQVARADGGIV